jgi:preprotein translocase subunit YajC
VIDLSAIFQASIPVVAQAQPSTGEFLISLAPILVIFLIFYFLLLRPARKRQQDLQRLIEGLKKGDKVLTNGGLYGEVVSVDGPVVQLKIADNVKVRVAKAAVSGLEASAEKAAEKLSV